MCGGDDTRASSGRVDKVERLAAYWKQTMMTWTENEIISMPLLTYSSA